MNWLASFAVAAAGLYLAVVGVMYLAQTRLLFPTWLAQLGHPQLPAAASRLEIASPDGVRLSGVRLPPTTARMEGSPTVLGFPGNAWNAEAMASTLHELLPEFEVVVFHYRGYRPSGGKPSAKALLADAVTVFDHLQGEPDAEPVVAVGVSIGTPVAAYLARERRLAGLVLVTPFDSLVELARGHYPWLPVRLLLRHRMATVDFVRGQVTPTAMIVAGSDTIVPARRSEPLRGAIANLVLDRTIEGAGHNDLYDRRAFRDAIREALARIRKASSTGESGAAPDPAD